MAKHQMIAIGQYERKKPGTKGEREIVQPGQIFLAQDDDEREFLLDAKTAIDDTKAVTPVEAAQAAQAAKAAPPAEPPAKKVEVSPTKEKPLTEKQRLLQTAKEEGVAIDGKPTVASLKKAIAAHRRKKKTGV